MLDNFSHFYLDLDRTIWTTFDKYKNPIWARQMIFPFVKISESVIEDDCGSRCFLDSGVDLFLKKIFKRDKTINFLSRGANLEVESNKQPSILLLETFGIFSLFNKDSSLVHKSFKKKDYIKNSSCEVCFIDDSDDELAEMRNFHPLIKCVKRDSFKNWNDL
jgi:predicted phosphatase